jgi:hypothetical protein
MALASLLHALPLAQVEVAGVTLARLVQLLMHPTSFVQSHASKGLVALLTHGGARAVQEALGLGLAPTLAAQLQSPNRPVRSGGLQVVGAVLAAGGRSAMEVSVGVEVACSSVCPQRLSPADVHGTR